VGFSHSSRPRAVCTPFRHLAFWLSGRHLGGRCGRHLHLIRLGRDFGRGFGGDRTCNGGRIRSHWLIRRRRVQQDRCREQAESEPARQRQPATPSRSREDATASPASLSTFFALTDCRLGRLGSVLNSPAATRPAADVHGQPAINQLNRGASFNRQAPDGCLSWLLLRRDGSKSHLRDLCRLIYADAQAAREIAGFGEDNRCRTLQLCGSPGNRAC
jgi:hypothetical protein